MKTVILFILTFRDSEILNILVILSILNILRKKPKKTNIGYCWFLKKKEKPLSGAISSNIGVLYLSGFYFQIYQKTSNKNTKDVEYQGPPCPPRCHFFDNLNFIRNLFLNLDGIRLGG